MSDCFLCIKFKESSLMKITFCGYIHRLNWLKSIFAIVFHCHVDMLRMKQHEL